MILPPSFFDRDACELARSLLGMVLRVRHGECLLSARIIETEAYYREEKGSHASLGFTEKRKALFMSPGTIYMYYARGGDSLNFSAQGEGNAVLIKSGFPYVDDESSETITMMQALNPINGRMRSREKLCCGQTLLCRSLRLKVPDWDQQQLGTHFYVEDCGLQAQSIVQTTRLGIPIGRDEHLLYRFIDYDFIDYCTSNPFTKRDKPLTTIIKQ